MTTIFPQAPQGFPSVAPKPGQTAPFLLDDPDEQSAFTVWRDDADGGREGSSQLRVSGMTCAACADNIEWALRQVPGVKEAHVSASAGRAQVRWDPAITRPSEWLQAVKAAGYEAAPDVGAAAHALRQAESRKMYWQLFVAGMCMMQVMMLAAPSYWTAPGEIAPDLQRVLNWGSWLLSLPVLVFSSGPFFTQAWRGLRLGQVRMDLPVSIGVWVTFLVSTVATFHPGGVFGHEVYFDSMTMFVFFLLAGRTLEMWARHKVAVVLEGHADRLPDAVERLDERGERTWVSPRRLRAGDHVLLPPGAACVADGRVVSGRSEMDESLMTGEAKAVHKQAGDPVMAGSLNLSGTLTIAVEKLGAQTQWSQIQDIMRQAVGERPAFASAAQRLAGPFLVGVLLISALAGGLWWWIAPEKAWWVAVSVLIVTCPCALSLATPAALLAAAAGLSRQGVLVRHLEALEGLSKVDTVVLDKTGTLTEPGMQLQHPTATPTGLAGVATLLRRAATAEDIDALVTSLAAHSLHPVSRAVSEGSKLRPAGLVQGDIGAGWTSVQEVPGDGLEGQWHLPQAALDEKLRTSLGHFEPSSVASGNHPTEPLDKSWSPSTDGSPNRVFRLGRPQWVMGGGTPAVDTGVVAFGPVGEIWWHSGLGETIRRDAHAALQALKNRGLAILVLSGDTPNRVAEVSRALGDVPYMGGVSPAQKMAEVARLQDAGRRVLMVGDGLNDAPVLARSDVSLAFVHGATLSKYQADGLLVGQRLSLLPETFDLAFRTRRVIHQNMSWAVVYNLSCIPVAVAGYLPPWAAGLGMALSSLGVVLNAMRLGRVGQSKPH